MAEYMTLFIKRTKRGAVMGNYIGKVCPFCKTEIKEGDSVKVCPACNIPHHEGCWTENKGCTTFGCSEQHYEEQGTNPSAVCSNCGTPLGDGQDFCHKCGTRKEQQTKNICSNCGAELADGQEFCGKCGTKVGVKINIETNAAINQFNANVQKKKKKSKVLPIVLAIVFAIVAIGGYFTYAIIQEKNLAEAVEQYKEDANTFYIKVLTSGTTMEDIGNEIQTSWRAYVNSSRYNGSRYYSVDSAIEAARTYKYSDISTVRTSNSTIETLYKDLLVIPDKDDQELLEIKEAVKEVYDAYKDMYDCVITPSGNYNSWTSEFSSVDSELADTIGDLGDLVR